jgi:hypothetical protein
MFGGNLRLLPVCLCFALSITTHNMQDDMPVGTDNVHSILYSLMSSSLSHRTLSYCSVRFQAVAHFPFGAPRIWEQPNDGLNLMLIFDVRIQHDCVALIREDLLLQGHLP